jgi:hypothetical protein
MMALQNAFPVIGKSGALGGSISDHNGSDVKGSTYDHANVEKLVPMVPNIKDIRSQSLGNPAHEQTHSNQERDPFCYIPYSTDSLHVRLQLSKPAIRKNSSKGERESKVNMPPPVSK